MVSKKCNVKKRTTVRRRSRKARPKARPGLKSSGKLSNVKLDLKGKKLELFNNTSKGVVKHKKGWVSISQGYIYINRDNGRSYWILHKIPKKERPKIHFSDRNKSIRIGSNRIVVKNDCDYEIAKQLLEKYSR